MKTKLSRTLLKYIAVLGIATLYISCDSKPEAKTELEKIQRLIQKNIDAVNKEDIDDYMSCLSPKGVNYANTRQEIGTAFQRFDIMVKLSKMDIKFESDDVAIVSIVEMVNYINPPGPETQVVLKNKLVKEDGEWKILDSSMMQ